MNDNQGPREMLDKLHLLLWQVVVPTTLTENLCRLTNLASPELKA